MKKTNSACYLHIIRRSKAEAQLKGKIRMRIYVKGSSTCWPRQRNNMRFGVPKLISLHGWHRDYELLSIISYSLLDRWDRKIKA